MIKKGDPRFDVNSAEVQAVLLGVMKCSPQSYYRINPDGQHVIVPIRRELMEALNICPKSASKLLKDAAIPYAPFIHNPPAEPVEPEPDPEAIMEAALEAEARETARQEKLAKKAELEERANSRRYQLVETNSGKFGIWQADEGRVIALFLTREEAIEEMARLRSGSSQAGLYYGSRRQRLPELQGTHY
jgi:hypothetical protein